MNRFLINICSNQLPETRDFYVELFGFDIAYDSDWFINLKHPLNSIEIGIISESSEIVPAGLSNSQNGIYFTFVVDSADDTFQKAQSMGVEIMKEPEDTFYGQRRLLIKDTNGLVVDVSSLIE